MLPGSEVGETVDPLETQHVNFANLERKTRGALSSCACNALQAERQSLFSHAPLNLPDLAHDPIAFTEVMLGIDWIDDLEAQAFLIKVGR